MEDRSYVAFSPNSPSLSMTVNQTCQGCRTCEDLMLSEREGVEWLDTHVGLLMLILGVSGDPS